jgi:hypothetical protein
MTIKCFLTGFQTQFLKKKTTYHSPRRSIVLSFCPDSKSKYKFLSKDEILENGITRIINYNISKEILNLGLFDYKMILDYSITKNI